MFKLLRSNNLSVRWQVRNRAAFSLAELVISIAILLLMLSLAGQVFNLTVKSTGQATAITRVDQDFRVLEQTLREDFRYVQPGQSVMVIQGNPVNAYWSRNGKDADDDGKPDTGYPHVADPERDDPTRKDALGQFIPRSPRADMLMFFTARPGSSYVKSTVRSGVQQIVYGHAEIGDYAAVVGAPTTNPTCDTSYSFSAPPSTGAQCLQAVCTKQEGAIPYPSPELISAIPAEQWHLARRAVLLQAGDRPVGNPPTQYGLDYAGTDPLSGKPYAIDSPYILQGAADTLWNFNFVNEVLKLTNPPANGLSASPLFLPRVFTHGNVNRVPYARSQLSLAPPALCADHMGSYFLPNCASFKVEWSLNPRSEFIAGRLDGIGETLWFDPGDAGNLPQTSDPPSPLRSLRNKVESFKTVYGAKDPRYLNLYDVLCCPGGQDCPSAARADGLTYSLAERFDPKIASAYCHEPPDVDFTQLWPDPSRPNLAVFEATRPKTIPGTVQLTSPTEFVADDVFPGALRITVDLYDPERRLEKPIRHVMVIPIGE